MQTNKPKRGKTSPILELKNKEWLKNKYIDENLTGDQIAMLLGCTKHPVMKALKKHGIPVRVHSSKYAQLNDKQWLKRKYLDEKMSIPDIATIVGCKPGAIHSSLIHMGIKTRGYKEGLKTKFPEGRWGKNSSNWRGGITILSQTIRECSRYKEWRLEIFKRDKFKCILDGSTKNIEADHYPKAFSALLKEYNVRSLDDALCNEELWDISNGRTLCHKCHEMTESFGARSKPIDLEHDTRSEIEKKIDMLEKSKRYYQQRNWQLQRRIIPELRERIVQLEAILKENGISPESS